MVTPLPHVLRALLARHAEACARRLEGDTTASRRALDDAGYTLCVTTGTRSVEEALARADVLLAAARGRHSDGPSPALTSPAAGEGRPAGCPGAGRP
ncbi:DUF5133 domain-containing protein [Streptomyces sp. NPDC096080]|uniref:DUF5133 domain-containing protein n=1 Tax=Streptomyces sp. NPDC096080 TaxID=3156693 RepID=UPI003332971B